jgi:hypothetical protein
MDLGAALLRAALGYARERVRELLDPDDLAAALGVPIPDAATRDRVAAHLIQAGAEADALTAVLPGPVTVDNARQASQHLMAAVTALRRAAAELGADDNARLTNAVSAVPDPRGVAAQLGLSAPPGIQVDATSLSYTLSSANADLAGVGQVDQVRLVARLASDGPGLSIRLSLTQARLALGSGAGSVVQAILGAAGLDVAADVALTVDTSRGLTANGTLGPIALPARSPSPLLRSVAATLLPDAPVPALRLTATSAGALGSAVKALLDGFGLDIPVDPARVLDGTAPIGLPAIRAPQSIGLAITAGPISGGGYIGVSDVPGGRRYSGALQLRLGPLDVKAFGVLTDRGDGFSLAVVLSVEFVPAIEIALGFTVNAVGGIVGLDVVVDTDALRSQLRSGALQRLMFPPDPIAAAPAILQTVATVFPPRPGGFVIGPMLSLGWGRPTLVRLDLAVVVSLPETTVVLLARLWVAIPAPEAPLIDLKAEIYGEFSARRVVILASLVDSRVVFFSVSGDIGLLTRFGDDATMAISAGGFHPRFTPPAELAGMRRICVEMSPPVGLQFKVQGYVAVTTNTVQFGGRVDIAYSIGVAAVYGYLALDALIRFDPFGFELDIAAGVGVEVLGFTLCSIDLALHLSGPAPWRVLGTGKVRLPWPLPDPSISVGPIEWGPSAPPLGPSVSPARLVADALSKPAAWTRVDQPQRSLPVALRDVDATPGQVLVDPWSLVRGTQSAVPLDTDIVKVGGQPVHAGETRVTLDDPAIAGTIGAAWSQDRQAFPLGQFLDLTDDAALAAPSFEQRPAGLVIDPADLSAVSGGVGVTLQYETSFPFEPTPRRRRDTLFTRYEAALTLGATRAGASELRRADRYAEEPDPIDVASASEARVAWTDTLGGVLAADTRLPWSDAAAALRATGLPPSRAQLVGAGA